MPVREEVYLRKITNKKGTKQMLTRLTKRREGEGGFTIVELLVVLLIIGILTAIAIPAFYQQRQRAWDASAESDSRNIVTTIATAANDYSSVSPDAVVIKGWSPGKEMDLDVTFIRGGLGMSVSGGTKTYEGEIKLSKGTRGSVGGTLANYTICLYNPNGIRWESPETAMVWDSARTGTLTDGGLGSGSFREAQSNDECVRVARAGEDASGDPVPPGTPGDGGDDDDESGDPGQEIDLGITAIIGEPKAYHIMGNFNTGIHFPITLMPEQPEMLDDIETLSLVVGGEERLFDTYGGNTGMPAAPGGIATPGGMVEVKLGDYVLGARDFSAYEFIGHAVIDPSDLAMSRSDLPQATSWVESVTSSDATWVEVNQYYNDIAGWYTSASVDGDHHSDYESGVPLFGNYNYLINARYDITNGIVHMEYQPLSGGDFFAVTHYVDITPGAGGGGDSGGNEEHPMIAGQPMGFSSGSAPECAAHEDAFKNFQSQMYAEYPNIWGANYDNWNGVEIEESTPDGWFSHTGTFSGFSGDVFYAHISHSNGYFVGSVELEGNIFCETVQ